MLCLTKQVDSLPNNLRISNKYGSVTSNKFLMKSVTTLKNITYIQNTHRIRSFKLTFADWLKFSMIEELTYEIDVRFREKFLTNGALDLMKPRLLRLRCLFWSLFQGSYTLPYLLHIRR
jgi:adenine specific DNA methylase Mod